MPRNTWRIHDTTDVRNLVKQLNPILEQLTIQLQRIEGLDDYTTEFFGDITHTGTNIGLFSATAAPQQAAITDLSGTPTDAEIQTAVNALIAVQETFGWIADA